MNEALKRIENQVGPCGILCDACLLGSGTVADSAGRTRKQIADCQIPMWAPFVPGGEAIDWAAVDRGLDGRKVVHEHDMEALCATGLRQFAKGATALTGRVLNLGRNEESLEASDKAIEFDPKLAIVRNFLQILG